MKPSLQVDHRTLRTRTDILDVEVYPKMPRKKSKAVPVGNGSVPEDTSGIGGITMEETRRIMSEALNKSFDNFYGLKPQNPMEMKATDQLLAILERDAPQLRLATEADVPTDKKTRKRAEDASADQAKHGDSCSTKRAHAGPTSLTSFSKDVFADKGAEAPKPHLPPVEVRMLPSAAGRQMSAGTASTAMRTIFPLSFFLEGSER